jgi:hypothetical protein
MAVLYSQISSIIVSALIIFTFYLKPILSIFLSIFVQKLSISCLPNLEEINFQPLQCFLYEMCIYTISGSSAEGNSYGSVHRSIPGLYTLIRYLQWGHTIAVLTVNNLCSDDSKEVLKSSLQAILATSSDIFLKVCVSPGIEPGYIVFPSHK